MPKRKRTTYIIDADSQSGRYEEFPTPVEALRGAYRRIRDYDAKSVTVVRAKWRDGVGSFSPVCTLVAPEESS